MELLPRFNNDYDKDRNNCQNKKKRSFAAMNADNHKQVNRTMHTESVDDVAAHENLDVASEGPTYLTLNDIKSERVTSQDETSSVYSNISVVKYIIPSKYETRKNVQNKASSSVTLLAKDLGTTNTNSPPNITSLEADHCSCFNTNTTETNEQNATKN